MVANPKKASKNEFGGEKKLTIRDFISFGRKKEDSDQIIEDKTAVNDKDDGITMTIIDDICNINNGVYTINEEQVQKFFQFIKEKAFYQQLGPQIVMNKFKDIIGYDK